MIAAGGEQHWAGRADMKLLSRAIMEGFGSGFYSQGEISQPFRKCLIFLFFSASVACLGFWTLNSRWKERG